MNDKITYEDIEEYGHLFTLAPAFILETMARTNANLVSKFESAIKNHMDNLTPAQRDKLHIILDSDIDYLQEKMAEAFNKTRKKQYRVLANPAYRDFIEKNLNEIKKML